LPDDNLCKVDRASMHFSVEVRSPLLDESVVNFAHSIDHKYRMKGSVTKRILKDILYEWIPREMMERPKMGFSVPIDTWLKRNLRDELIEYSRSGFLNQQGLFDGKATESIIDRWMETDNKPGRGRNIKEIVWAFFVFQKWYQRYKTFI